MHLVLSNNIKYEAAGFLESLIAVAITGLAGVLLLSVAMSTIDQTLDNEAYDEMTNSSAALKHKISYLVEIHNEGNPDDPILSMLSSAGGCFDLGDKFVSEIVPLDVASVCPYAIEDGQIDRDSCDLTGEIGVFDFVCVNTNSNDSILSVDVVSGDIACIEDDCKDFIDKEIYLLK
jgi:hypothetical protein